MCEIQPRCRMTTPTLRIEVWTIQYPHAIWSQVSRQRRHLDFANAVNRSHLRGRFRRCTTRQLRPEADLGRPSICPDPSIISRLFTLFGVPFIRLTTHKTDSQAMSYFIKSDADAMGERKTHQKRCAGSTACVARCSRGALPGVSIAMADYGYFNLQCWYSNLRGVPGKAEAQTCIPEY